MKRIVSLLPSATELLCAIEGGRELLVGRSHECDYPGEITSLSMLTAQRTTQTTSADIDAQVRSAMQNDETTSLYTLDAELLASLQPDVILTQDLCDVCSIDLNTVRAIAADLSPQPKIVSLNPMTMEDVFDDLITVGEAVGLERAAQNSLIALRERYWSAVDYVNPYIDGPEIGFLEWLDPLFCAGHWTPQLIRAAGGRHALNEPGEKSRQIEPEDLLAVMPDRIILSPCGFDLNTIRRELPAVTETKWWPMLPAVQDKQVVLVDGSQMFNRPGPRLVDAFCWLVGWINDRPELIPADFPMETL